MDTKVYIFFITGLLGILTTLQIVIPKKDKGILNGYFAILILILTFRQFTSIMNINIQNKTPVNDLYTTLVTLTLFPILYLYFYKITSDILKTNKPFPKLVIGLIILNLTLNIILLIIENKNQNILHKYIIDLLYTGLFNYLNFKLLNTYLWKHKTNNKIEKFAIKWSVFLMILFFLAPLKYTYQIIYYLVETSVIVDNNFQPITSICTIGMCVFILIKPNHFYNLNLNPYNNQFNFTEINVKNKLIWNNDIEVNIINKADVDTYKRIVAKIEYYIEKINSLEYENHVLLNPNSKIIDLAQKLQIPKSHLMFLFKYNCKLSFVDYKKMIRIEKAKKLIENNYLEINTLNSLSYKVGFKSYDPFYKSFKEITNYGPMEYNIFLNNFKKNKN